LEKKQKPEGLADCELSMEVVSHTLAGCRRSKPKAGPRGGLARTRHWGGGGLRSFGSSAEEQERVVKKEGFHVGTKAGTGGGQHAIHWMRGRGEKGKNQTQERVYLKRLWCSQMVKENNAAQSQDYTISRVWTRKKNQLYQNRHKAQER